MTKWMICVCRACEKTILDLTITIEHTKLLETVLSDKEDENLKVEFGKKSSNVKHVVWFFDILVFWHSTQMYMNYLKISMSWNPMTKWMISVCRACKATILDQTITIEHTKLLETVLCDKEDENLKAEFGRNLQMWHVWYGFSTFLSSYNSHQNTTELFEDINELESND